jgi:hypothetical protein
MKKLLGRLQKKYWRLPLWAWASAAGGAAWFWMKRKGASSTAADTTATSSADTLPGPVDAYGASDSAGDLSGMGSPAGAGGQLTGTPEQFADAGVTSDFQDFMGQLEAKALDEQPTAVTTAPVTPGAEAVDPTTTATAKLPPKPAAKGRARGIPKWVPARRGEKGHWALPNGSWAKPPKGAKPPKPKPVPRPSTKPKRTNRVTALLGKGKAGARARPPAPKAKPKPAPPPKARPRGIAKKTTAVARPKPKPKPKPFALPGMKPIGRR